MYTVIGDAVNVAARLEGMTKEFAGNPVLVNKQTYDAIATRREIVIEDFGPHQVKGRREPVHIFGVRRADIAATELVASDPLSSAPALSDPVA